QRAIPVFVDHDITFAAPQRFAVLGPAPVHAIELTDIIRHALSGYRLAVQVKNVVDHLDPIARQPDHAFDKVGGIVAGKLEHDHVAALRRKAWEAAMHHVA